MKCPECGNEINDNDVFCGSCGAEIIYNTIGAVENENGKIVKADENPDEEGKTSQKKRRSKRSKKDDKKDGKKSLAAVKAAGVIAAVAVIAIVIVYISLSVRASQGRKIFDVVPLGRDIDIIETETGTAFISGESSKFGALNHIADYDYICESEKSVNVGGIELPEWAVLLRKSGGSTVGEAVLYNFYEIKHNWMGSKAASEIETSVIEYGSALKKAESKLGLKPYTIIKESTENTSLYVYRYHYTDGETGNTIVKNFYISVSDVDGQVKDVYDEQLDYLKLILQAE